MNRMTEILMSTAADNALGVQMPASLREKKKRHVSKKEFARIYEMLKDNLRQLSDSVCEYKNPEMTDAKIAQLIHPDLHAHHVTPIRLDIFGQLRVQSPAALVQHGLKERVDDIERRLMQIEAFLKQLGYLNGSTP